MRPKKIVGGPQSWSEAIRRPGWAGPAIWVAHVRFEVDDRQGVRRALEEIANSREVEKDQPFRSRCSACEHGSARWTVKSQRRTRSRTRRWHWRAPHDHAGLLFATQVAAPNAFQRGDRRGAAQHLEVVLNAAADSGEQYTLTRVWKPSRHWSRRHSLVMPSACSPRYP